MDIFARRLKQLRLDAGEKQIDLQSALHCSQGMVSAYENGREPSYDTLIAIAGHYSTSTDYLLGLTSTRTLRSSSLDDDLTAVISAVISAAEAAGTQTVTADDLQALISALRSYLTGERPAGTLPVAITRQLITGMTAMLEALGSGSTAAVIGANNALLSTVLGISGITTAYLDKREESST